MERRLDGGNGGFEDRCRFRERIAEDVDQYDRSALRRRQGEEGGETQGHLHAGGTVGARVGILFIQHYHIAAPLAERVDRSVARDPEQPGLRPIYRRGARIGLCSPRHGFLHDILAINGRAHHASAKAVEARPHIRQPPVEPNIVQAVHHVLTVHPMA